MHNLMSSNQLAGWANWDYHDTQNEAINDYYECLIDCDDTHSNCKRICREVLF